MSPRKVKAFTLIELLVVIAIISILAAILFPVFARARENARRTSCLSNMKQIGLGVMQYTQDYDEKYPIAWYGTSAANIDTNPSKPSGRFRVGSPIGNYVTWMDFIFPYVKSTQLFVCPSTRVGSPTPNYSYSVALNGLGAYVSAFGGTTPSDTPISLASVKRPAEVVCIIEYASSYAYMVSPSNVLTYINDPAYPTILTPHLNGGNAIFADGHAKWRTRSTIASQIPTGATACNLSAPTATRYCSRAWNPFLD